MTGKAIVPIISQGKNRYRVTLLEQEILLNDKDELDEMVKTIQNRGYYPYITTPDEVTEISTTPGKSDELFVTQTLKSIARWMEYADEKLGGTGIRCYVCPGNDDMFQIDKVISSSKCVELAEGKVIHLDDHHEMISTGWSNPTPWNTPREEPDESLGERLKGLVQKLGDISNAVFNFHAPPFGSGLDEAPELTKDLRPAYAGRSLVPVGSRAVLEMVQKYQPLLGLFGHIHEGKGAFRYGRTLCINPGSMYEQGILHGAVIELKARKIAHYLLTTG